MLRIVRLRALTPLLATLSTELHAELAATLMRVNATAVEQLTMERLLAAALHAIATGDLADFTRRTDLSDDAVLAIDAWSKDRGHVDGAEVFPPKPLEPLDHLLHRVKTNAFHTTDDNTAQVKSPSRRRSVGVDRLIRAMASMTVDQLEVYLALAEGRMALVDGLAFRVVPLGWTVHGVDAKAEEHTVLKDLSSCTCQDNRFRGRECKHIKALRKLT